MTSEHYWTTAPSSCTTTTATGTAQACYSGQSWVRDSGRKLKIQRTWRWSIRRITRRTGEHDPNKELLSIALGTTNTLAGDEILRRWGSLKSYFQCKNTRILAFSRQLRPRHLQAPSRVIICEAIGILDHRADPHAATLNKLVLYRVLKKKRRRSAHPLCI